MDDINVLIVDDEEGMRESLGDILAEEGYKVTGAGTADTAAKELKKSFYNIVLLDLRLPDRSGLELLNTIKEAHEETMSIVMTGCASMESAVSALNKGAFAYIQKPFSMDEVLVYIKKALGMQRLARDNKILLNRFKELSLKDHQTGLHNHRYLVERLEAELARAKRHSLSLSLV
ncbi:MAG: response regulator, partial [Candidatus Omnitrophota bacterium]